MRGMLIEIEVVEVLALVEVVVVMVAVEGLIVFVVSSGNTITPVMSLCFCTPNFCGDGSLCPCGKSSHLCPPGCCCLLVVVVVGLPISAQRVLKEDLGL